MHLHFFLLRDLSILNLALRFSGSGGVLRNMHGRWLGCNRFVVANLHRAQASERAMTMRRSSLLAVRKSDCAYFDSKNISSYSTTAPLPRILFIHSTITDKSRPYAIHHGTIIHRLSVRRRSSSFVEIHSQRPTCPREARRTWVLPPPRHAGRRSTPPRYCCLSVVTGVGVKVQSRGACV